MMWAMTRKNCQTPTVMKRSKKEENEEKKEE